MTALPAPLHLCRKLSIFNIQERSKNKLADLKKFNQLVYLLPDCLFDAKICMCGIHNRLHYSIVSGVKRGQKGVKNQVERLQAENLARY